MSAKRRKPMFNKTVLNGLLNLAAHADAGGADDLEIDVESADGAKRWKEVEKAIQWVFQMRDYKADREG